MGRDAGLLAVVLVVTAALAPAALGLAVDAENLAMKSNDSAAQRADDLRKERFGDLPVIVALLEPRGEERFDAAEEAELDEWIRSLTENADVAELQRLPLPGAGANDVFLAIVPRVEADGRYAEPAGAIVERLQASHPIAARVSISGQPVVETVLARELVREQERVVPWLIVALAAFLFAVYRAPGPALGALLVPLAGVVGLNGFEGKLGLPLNPVSALLAPAILTVGVAASIHVVEHVRALRTRGLALAPATQAAARELARPFVLTSTTTVGGFLGLELSPIPAVRSFGLLAALGTLLVTGLAWCVLPAWLRLCGCPPGPQRGAGNAAAIAATWIHCQRRRIVVGALVLAVLFGWSWTRIRVDTHPLDVLPAHHELRRESARIAAVTGGLDTLDLLLEAPAPPGGALRLAGLAARLSETEGLVGAAGPPRRDAAGDFLLPVLLRPGGAAAHLAAADRAVAAAHESGWERVSASGLALRVAADSHALVRSQLLGLGSTLLLLFAIMALGFRSLRTAALGLVPNAVPCLLVYGGLAFLGRPLSVASALIGTVLLGLIVDDTIHFLHAYAGERRLGRGSVSAVARGLRACGRPIVLTSACLVVGFSMPLFGRLNTTREFGALASVTVILALVGDLVLLPALLGARAERPLAEAA